jgi:hypothetical protein
VGPVPDPLLLRKSSKVLHVLEWNRLVNDDDDDDDDDDDHDKPDNTKFVLAEYELYCVICKNRALFRSLPTTPNIYTEASMIHWKYN